MGYFRRTSLRPPPRRGTDIHGPTTDTRRRLLDALLAEALAPVDALKMEAAE
jgi:hypothetical protein